MSAYRAGGNKEDNKKTYLHMRKMYQQPATTVAEVVMTTQILTGSAVVGVNAEREGYGTGIEDSWN